MNADVAVLMNPWPGPAGGLPPWDHATPQALEAALHEAVALRRAELAAIAGNPAPPDFENTVAALEDSGRAVQRVQRLLRSVATTNGGAEIDAVARRVAALAPPLVDEAARDARLFARVQAVWRAREAAGLDDEQRRLVEVLVRRLQRAGGGLAPADGARLQAIDARLAALSMQFQQNVAADEAGAVLWLTDERDLAGLPAAAREGARAAARARGRPDAWAIPNQRPAVWPFLTHATRRDLREQVWRRWQGRGRQPGAHDNRPLLGEILQLRGEKARLLGQPSHAHAVLADRMAGTPERALGALLSTWQAVLMRTRQQVAEMQALADAEGADFALAPWDRLHYAEKLRRRRFGFDAEELRRHLPLEGLLQALFWAAGRLYRLEFSALPEAPVLHPSVRVWEVRRDGAAIGVLVADLLQRPGKRHGSHQAELRSAESFRGRVLPVSMIVSGVPPAPVGRPVLLGWEFANVLFHEFGHALHMLLNEARHPSLGSLQVAWDFVELPSLLNECWLRDPVLQERFARDPDSGQAMPAALRDRLAAALHHERIFSVQLDYLASAIVDLRLHLLADGSGRAIDAVQVQQQVLDELAMPAAWDLTLDVAHNLHSFAGGYDAGLYAYLWSDMMAADVAEAFAAAPGGFYDPEVAERWRRCVLAAGHTVDAAEAFRRFRGRDPDPQALLRRFGLAA